MIGHTVLIAVVRCAGHGAKVLDRRQSTCGVCQYRVFKVGSLSDVEINSCGRLLRASGCLREPQRLEPQFSGSSRIPDTLALVESTSYRTWSLVYLLVVLIITYLPHNPQAVIAVHPD